MRLIEFWPPLLRELLEFREIAGALQPEADMAHDDVREAAQELFLESMSVRGIRRWETMLSIYPAAGESLDDRRRRIVLLVLNRLPYTYRALQRYLAEVSDVYTLRLSAAAYTLHVTVELSSAAKRLLLSAILRQMIPANMLVDLVMKLPSTATRTEVCVAAHNFSMVRHMHHAQ